MPSYFASGVHRHRGAFEDVAAAPQEECRNLWRLQRLCHSQVSVIDCGGQNPRYRLGPEVLMKSSAAAHVVYMQVHAMLMAAHAWPWPAAEDQAC